MLHCSFYVFQYHLTSFLVIIQQNWNLTTTLKLLQSKDSRSNWKMIAWSLETVEFHLDFHIFIQFAQFLLGYFELLPYWIHRMPKDLAFVKQKLIIFSSSVNSEERKSSSEKEPPCEIRDILGCNLSAKCPSLSFLYFFAS